MTKHIIRYFAILVIFLAAGETDAEQSYCSACDYLGCYQASSCGEFECFNPGSMPECSICSRRLEYCDDPGICGEGYVDIECVFWHEE